MRIYQPESAALDQLAHDCLQPSAEFVSRKHLSVFFDFDIQIIQIDNGWLMAALQRILRLAVDRSPDCGEIEVTACCVENAVEIEVSDTGETPQELGAVPAFQRLRTPDLGSAYLRDLIYSLRSRGADFWGVACPQGGVAWTLRLPQRIQAQRAA